MSGKTFVILLLCWLFSKSSSAQSSNYVVLVFEESYRISMHGTKRYLWVLPEQKLDDSLLIGCLLTGYFTKEVLIKCTKGERMNVFNILPEETVILGDSLRQQVQALRKIIKNHKKKIMSVRFDWTMGQRKTITIYGVPVKGVFCNGRLDRFEEIEHDYFSTVFLPTGPFSFDEGFWETDYGKRLLRQDFSTVPYDKLGSRTFYRE
ncbi:MAG: hypothetical protein EOO14_25500 [Chitinophagaceae bacterium]|nr:MAG: hypothetical protein EOO14_25500 [Chitinophagaceae bacterium]